MKDVDQKEIENIYRIIKDEVLSLVESVMEQELNDPEKEGLLVKKG